MKMIIFLLNLFFQRFISLDNGLGLTPQMGWNSWNKFGFNKVNQNVITSTIEALSSNGLREAGYEYVILDDGWAKERGEDGTIQYDPIKFPKGIAYLADIAHNHGLKFGLYANGGKSSQKGSPGSLGHEAQDAKTWADWGVDYIKYDNPVEDEEYVEERFSLMSEELRKTGKKIFFSLCNWGRSHVETWGREYGNSWRTTGDIDDDWNTIISIIDQNNQDANYARPGGWNDPDMLEVGNGKMNYEEYKVHFGLWALVKAPLLIGCNVSDISQENLNILTNPEVIAINQDPLGIQGTKLEWYGDNNETEIWGGPLSDDNYTVLLLNKDEVPRTIIANFTKLFEEAKTNKWIVRDLWAKKDLGEVKDTYSSEVGNHSSLFLRISPK